MQPVADLTNPSLPGVMLYIYLSCEQEAAGGEMREEIAPGENAICRPQGDLRRLPGYTTVTPPSAVNV